MRVQALGMPIEMQIIQTGEVNEDLTLRSFRFEYRASGQQTYLMGTVEPSGIQLVSRSEGYSATKTIPISTPVYHTDSIQLLLAQEVLEVGKKVSYAVFEPMLSAIGTVHAAVLDREKLELPDGDEVSAYKVEIEFKGLSTQIWINENGDVFKEISEAAGIPFLAVRETEEQARDLNYISRGIGENNPNAAPLDLVDSSKVVPNRLLPHPESIRRLEIKTTGMEVSNLILDGTLQALQSHDDGHLAILLRQYDYAGMKGRLHESRPPYSPTFTGGKQGGIEPSGLDEYLHDDLYIQTSHPRIRQKAIEITLVSTNPWDAACAIASYLYQNIQKEGRGTIPSSLEVLNTMKGDCTEHSSLFTALARAIGIPTKIVTGLVYTNQGFFYHAWNEVFIAGDWVPIDSTLNRLEVDATHIKLAEGSLDQQAEIVQIIGKLKIEILSFELPHRPWHMPTIHGRNEY